MDVTFNDPVFSLDKPLNYLLDEDENSVITAVRNFASRCNIFEDLDLSHIQLSQVNKQLIGRMRVINPRPEALNNQGFLAKWIRIGDARGARFVFCYNSVKYYFSAAMIGGAISAFGLTTALTAANIKKMRKLISAPDVKGFGLFAQWVSAAPVHLNFKILILVAVLMICHRGGLFVNFTQPHFAETINKFVKIEDVTYNCSLLPFLTSCTQKVRSGNYEYDDVKLTMIDSPVDFPYYYIPGLTYPLTVTYGFHQVQRLKDRSRFDKAISISEAYANWRVNRRNEGKYWRLLTGRLSQLSSDKVSLDFLRETPELSGMSLFISDELGFYVPKTTRSYKDRPFATLDFAVSVLARHIRDIIMQYHHAWEISTVDPTFDCVDLSDLRLALRAYTQIMGAYGRPSFYYVTLLERLGLPCYQIDGFTDLIPSVSSAIQSGVKRLCTSFIDGQYYSTYADESYILLNSKVLTLSTFINTMWQYRYTYSGTKFGWLAKLIPTRNGIIPGINKEFLYER